MGPKVAKRKAASQATVNVVEEVAGPSVEKNQKSTWTAKETDTLVAEFISRKVRPRLIISLHSYKIFVLWFQEIIIGAFSSTNTKQDKYKAWDEIHRNIVLDCPTGDPKTVAQVKKKWENLVKDAKVEIAKYNAAVRGTGIFLVINKLADYEVSLLAYHFHIVGGGPSYVWKNEIFKKIYEQAIGTDNPSLPGSQIQVSTILRSAFF